MRHVHPSHSSGTRIYFGWQYIEGELLHTLGVFVARDIVTDSVVS